ncbi:uncharacterized protein LOC124288558 [Haliotis rubra]|uniref:uncharacterized protein LOC124288558 n=1 Tax=Haliotis rubra TaxID=36100 RepID=UPI001EE4F572|nr:uncharacterized protein LOC124288558 [Haliotis rubra]
MHDVIYAYSTILLFQLTLRSRAVDRGKKIIVFLVPIFASVTVNIIAGFFYMSFLLVVQIVVSSAFDEDGDMVAKVQNTFRVFSALAAAACAPLMIRYGFRKVALGGSVLLIFSCISSSLTTTADILAIPYGFMGGIALGLLRTTGVVATIDYLNTRPALALFISYISFIIGNIIGIIVIIFDLIQYLGSRRSWSNVMRVFEITAVIGLLAGSFLQKNSQTQQNVPKVFKHPPFYFLIWIRVAASVGLSILIPSAQTIPSERGFSTNLASTILYFVLFGTQLIVLIVLLIIRKFQRENLKKTALLTMGILVLVIGLGTMVHQVAFVNVWVVGVFTLVLGAVIAFAQVMMPLALVHTTGRSNLKLSLPILGCFEEVGGLVGGSSMAKILQETSSVSGALYFAGVSLIFAGVGAIIAWVLIKRWPPLSDEPVAQAFVRGGEDIADETGDELGNGDTTGAQ